jgi:hypothetical protein
VTVVRSDRPGHKAATKLDEAEQIKRLIEIQRQIVELAEQNELTAKECEALRRELSQSTRRAPKGRRGINGLRDVLERLKNLVT